MDNLQGHVYAVEIIPWRPDALFVRYGIKPHSYANYTALFSVAPGAEVTCDGVKVGPAELFAFLLGERSVVVTVRTDPQLYGLSMETCFTTEVVG